MPILISVSNNSLIKIKNRALNPDTCRCVNRMNKSAAFIGATYLESHHSG